MNILIKYFIAAIFLQTLSSGFVYAGATADLSLTSAEKKWLDTHSVIRVGLQDSLEPIVIALPNGSYRGLVPEIYNLIATRMGIQFKYISGAETTLIDKLAENDISLLGMIDRDLASQQNFLSIDAPLDFSTDVFINKKDKKQITSSKDLIGLKVAYDKKRVYFQNYFQAMQNQITSIAKESALQAIMAVVDGEADVMVGVHFNRYLLSNYSIEEVEPAYTLQEVDIDTVIAVSPSQPLFYSILQKAFSSLTAEELKAIQDKWGLPGKRHEDQFSLELTTAEQDYLNSKKILKNCIDPYWMPFEQNENGKHIGMTAEYMALFAKNLGIKIQFVPTTSWAQTLTYAQSRECDFVTAIADRVDRRKYLNFTDRYMESPLMLATLASEPDNVDLHTLENKTVAVPRGYASLDVIKAYYPNLKIVEVASTAQGLAKVANHEVFSTLGVLAVLGYEIQKNYYGELKLNGKLSHNWHISMGTRNDEPLLNSIFNKMIDVIPTSKYQQFFNHWLTISVNQVDPNGLSAAELAFIKKHPKVRVSVRENAAPFEFSEQGKAAGITVDYIKMAAQKIGLNVEFIINKQTRHEAMAEMAGSRKLFDIVSFGIANQARREKFSFGDTFLSYPLVIVTHKDIFYIRELSDLNGHTVVVEENYLSSEWIKRDHPEINVIEADNTFMAIKSVNDGAADAYVGNLGIANYLMANGEMGNIKIAAPTEYDNMNYRFIAPKEWPELAAILSKGFRRISPSEHSAIQQKWFTLRTIKQTNYTLVWQVIGTTAFILFGIVLWNRKITLAKQKTEDALGKLKILQQSLEQRNEELHTLSVTDPLTALFNRAKLTATLEEQFSTVLRYQDHCFTIVMIDIDNFKAVNDVYGHQVGDQLLIEISGLLRDNIRNVDTIGRWGGEEFLIVCPYSSRQGGTLLAENLRQKLATTDFSHVGKKTASFGVAAYQKGDTLASLVHRADTALYQSKAQGRNQVNSL